MSDKPVVLIVDDDRNTREGLQRALRRRYQVVTAESGERALELVGETPPAIVLSDVRMPGMDGITLLRRLRAHIPDCIAILLGSYQAYLKEFSENPGTYYLTKGWLESGSDPLREYHQALEKYGAENAEWLMDQQYRHYKRLVFVAHTREDLETYRPRALEVAEYCKQWGMSYEEVLGSEDYIRDLVKAVGSLSESDEQFLVIPPGGSIEQSQFLRIHV